MTRSATLIYNPHAGRPRDRHHAAARMVDALRRRGLQVEARATAGPGDAERLSRDALAANVDTVIVHGGDGTVNEALQPLVRGTTALAVWPGGTANVLAYELGLPRAVEPVADMIAAGRAHRVSIGQAGQRYFLLITGVGMDAAVVRAVNRRLEAAGRSSRGCGLPGPGTSPAGARTPSSWASTARRGRPRSRCSPTQRRMAAGYESPRTRASMECGPAALSVIVPRYGTPSRRRTISRLPGPPAQTLTRSARAPPSEGPGRAPTSGDLPCPRYRTWPRRSLG